MHGGPIHLLLYFTQVCNLCCYYYLQITDEFVIRNIIFYCSSLQKLKTWDPLFEMSMSSIDFRNNLKTFAIHMFLSLDKRKTKLLMSKNKYFVADISNNFDCRKAAFDLRIAALSHVSK